MACPFFIPREIVNDGSWLHPARLPLGAGWRGSCGSSEVEAIPDEETVRDSCNLGYARACPRLAADHDWDSVRFSVALSSPEQVTLWFVCEANHAPREHGKITYNLVAESWVNQHSDARVQRLADAYLIAFRAQRERS